MSLAAVAACLLAGMSLLAHADDAATAPDSQDQRSSVLDGLAFEGEAGETGKPASGEDVWVFENGTFASRECRECGKAGYQAQSADGGIRFRAEMTCPDSDIALVYTGLVKDDRIEGTFTWTKERWLWDIEKTFSFEGERIANGESATSQTKSSTGSCSETPYRPPGSSDMKPAPSAQDRFLRFP